MLALKFVLSGDVCYKETLSNSFIKAQLTLYYLRIAIYGFDSICVDSINGNYQTLVEESKLKFLQLVKRRI